MIFRKKTDLCSLFLLQRESVQSCKMCAALFAIYDSRYFRQQMFVIVVLVANLLQSRYTVRKWFFTCCAFVVNITQRAVPANSIKAIAKPLRNL